jgi:hypothetical protein
MQAKLRLAALLVLVAAAAGCSNIKSAYQEHYSNEMGREGWWKGKVTASMIEGVRHGERVIIASGPKAGEYTIKIDPRALSFDVPPEVIKVVSVARTGIDGEARVYGIPKGWTWTRVREWYLKWFDFKRVK